VKKYNKLVRDKIPEIIEKSGRSCSVKVLGEEEYQQKLKEKLREEMLEFLQSQSDQESIEELADMLEVIYSIAESKGYSQHQLEAIRKEKEGNRGGFKNRLFLMYVHD
jgi:predicted house-cleaning noncanonical NTP pyrophosphatase (MazG superfamily)